MIGNRIKQLRKRIELNQKEFGKYLDVTDSAISQLESNKTQPSKKLIKALCTMYSVNQEWLETGKGEMFGVNRFQESETRSSAGNADTSWEHTIIARSMKHHGIGERSIGEVERYARMVDALSEIFASGHEETVTAIESNLISFQNGVRSYADNKEKDKKISDLEARLEKMEKDMNKLLESQVQDPSPLSIKKKER